MSVTRTFIIENRMTGIEAACITVTADEITRCLGSTDGSLVFASNDQKFLLHVVPSMRAREVKLPGDK